MYIAPNGICHVLKDVPLDDTYEHTLWFDMDNKRSQYDYFISKKKYTFTGLTYTRYGEGIIIVQKPAEQMYDCNYLMFQNTGYGDKWFYAFITRVEYENNTTSTIYFKLDVMQTWHFDYTPQQCFVEREHSVTDVIGENLVPENLETGDYITTNTRNHLFGSTAGITFYYVLATQIPIIPSYSLEKEYTNEQQQLVANVADMFEDGGLIGGMPLPVKYARLVSVPTLPNNPTINGKTIAEQISIISTAFSMCGITDALIGFFLYAGSAPNVGSDVEESDLPLATRQISKVPRNNKLYTYPYVALEMSDNTSAVELKYELFSGQPTAKLIKAFGPTGKNIYLPSNYGGKEKDFDLMLSVNNSMGLCWINNYYQNWLAQNKDIIKGNVISATGGVISTIGSGVSSIGKAIGDGNATNIAGAVANTVGGLTSAIGGITSLLGQVRKHAIIPDTLGGNVNDLDSMYVSGELGLRSYCKSIRPEFVTIIDDYFTRYGYATHLTKVPNRNSRPHFNFVKTVRATLTGSVPADDMRVICSIYDAGVTFWKNGDEVGDYDVDNRP